MMSTFVQAFEEPNLHKMHVLPPPNCLILMFIFLIKKTTGPYKVFGGSPPNGYRAGGRCYSILCTHIPRFSPNTPTLRVSAPLLCFGGSFGQEEHQKQTGQRSGAGALLWCGFFLWTSGSCSMCQLILPCTENLVSTRCGCSQSPLCVYHADGQGVLGSLVE